LSTLLKPPEALTACCAITSQFAASTLGNA